MKPILILLTLSSLAAALTDPARVVPFQAPEPLGYREARLDPRYGYSVQRVTDTGAGVPIYSQLQGWNADQTFTVTKNRDILRAGTWERVHKVEWGWPAFGGGLRWSPTDPLALYYTGGTGGADAHAGACPAGRGRLMRYRLPVGTREMIHCFAEYTAILQDESHEELSEDGRYVALVGRRPDGVYEAFAYDIEARVKFQALELPRDAAGTPRSPDWCGMSPSGRHVLCMWGRGPERFKGLEAYDRETMAYAGKVTPSSGHGDMVRDSAGQEWYVYTNANNCCFLSGTHNIVKSKIPVGTVYNGATLDPISTVSTGASVALLQLDWEHGIHVSCRATRSPQGCVVSTYSGGANGWQAMERELIWVSLESRAAAPVINRLAQHHSDVEYARSLPDAQCPLTSYWVQPHAILSPDGRWVMFGSSWGQGCRAEAYVLDRQAGARPDTVRPPPPPPPPPPPVEVANPLDTLKPNQWYRLPRPWAGHPYQPRPWNNMQATPAGIMLWGGYGPTTERGNYCIYANALWRYNPRAGTAAPEGVANWRCWQEPQGYFIEALPENAATPTPIPRHSYNQMTFSPVDTSLYMAHGAAKSSNHPHDLWRYSLPAKRWISLGPAPGSTYPGGPAWDCVCEVHLIHAEGELWLFRSPSSVHIYTIATGAWRGITVGTVPAGLQLGSSGGYDPVRKRFFFYGGTESVGANNQFNLFHRDSLTWTRKTGPIVSRFAGIIYHPKHDRYMLGKGDGRSDLWAYAPAADAWQEVRSPVPLQVESSDWIEFAYDAGNDLLVNLEGETFWGMRYQPTDTTQPSLPPPVVAPRDTVRMTDTLRLVRVDTLRLRDTVVVTRTDTLRRVDTLYALPREWRLKMEVMP